MNKIEKAEKIKALRKSLGLSREKMGERYGINPANFKQWETGLRECPDYVFSLLEFRVKADLESTHKKAITLTNNSVD